jgi:hypothetical protein
MVVDQTSVPPQKSLTVSLAKNRGKRARPTGFVQLCMNSAGSVKSGKQGCPSPEKLFGRRYRNRVVPLPDPVQRNLRRRPATFSHFDHSVRDHQFRSLN